MRGPAEIPAVAVVLCVTEELSVPEERFERLGSKVVEDRQALNRAFGDRCAGEGQRPRRPVAGNWFGAFLLNSNNGLGALGLWILAVVSLIENQGVPFLGLQKLIPLDQDVVVDDQNLDVLAFARRGQCTE